MDQVKNIAPHSHYLLPIEQAENRIYGRSRNWGDIEVAHKEQIINQIVLLAKDSNYTTKETAFLLAVVQFESGFNPDAASKLSSATGLGQFIDKTGQAFGITAETRFDIMTNINALVLHLRENISAAKKLCNKCQQYKVFELAYARYHDGPSLAHGGLKLAKTFVKITTNHFLKLLNNSD